MAHNKHYSKKNDTFLKKMICIFASFLLAITLFVTALFTSVYFGYANKDSVLDAFNKSNFYNNVYQTAMGNCENEAIISGLDKEIFDGVFSATEMRNHCNTYILSYLNGDTYSIDTSKMESRLSENIKTYATENNLVVDGDIDTIISSFTSTVIAYYKTAIQFPYFDQIASIFSMFRKLMTYILPCMLIFSVVLILLLWRLNTYKKNRTFRYLAYSFLSASLSLLAIPAFIMYTGFYKKLLIKPDYVYYCMISYVENGLTTLLTTGLGLLIVGLICIFISCMIKSKLKKEHTAVHHSELADSI